MDTTQLLWPGRSQDFSPNSFPSTLDPHSLFTLLPSPATLLPPKPRPHSLIGGFTFADGSSSLRIFADPDRPPSSSFPPSSPSLPGFPSLFLSFRWFPLTTISISPPITTTSHPSLARANWIIGRSTTSPLSWTHATPSWSTSGLGLMGSSALPWTQLPSAPTSTLLPLPRPLPPAQLLPLLLLNINIAKQLLRHLPPSPAAPLPPMRLLLPLLLPLQRSAGITLPSRSARTSLSRGRWQRELFARFDLFVV